MNTELDNILIPTRFISSYRLLTSPIGIVTRQKFRKCTGIALKAGGKTVYTKNGKNYISDKNHIMILPKGAKYEWTCHEQGECIVIDFDTLYECDGIYSVEVGDNGFFLSAFSKLQNLNFHDVAGRFEAMQQIYGVLAYLAKAASKRYVPKDKRHILTPAMDYIRENYSDPGVCNKELASLCGISTVYFRKTFEAVYGTSPIRYLHELRIGKAKAILCGDYGSVAQIAESVGYSSVYHFSKMFKQYTGQSPSDFAKMGRQP